MTKKYAVIGSSAVDVFAFSKFFRPQANANDSSTILLSHGSQLWLDNSMQEPGGNGLLSAITFARQNNNVDLYTKLSSDLFGKALEQITSDEKISLCGEYISAKHHTDTVLHISANGKDQTTLIYNESFNSFSKKSINKINNKVDYLHVASLPSEKSTLSSIVKWANKHQIKVTANLQYLNSLPSRYFIKFFKRCEIVVLNHDEACLLVGGFCSTLEVANKLSEIGLNHFVIFGEKAESVAYFQDKFYTATLKIKSNILEYTGVEAVFSAAYVEEFYKSADIIKALTRAITQASSVMTVAGARAGILYKPVRKPMSVKIIESHTLKGEL